MRDLTRLASRIVMFFMQFYYRLARHSRVSYKAYIDGRTRLAGAEFNLQMQQNSD